MFERSRIIPPQYTRHQHCSAGVLCTVVFNSGGVKLLSILFHYVHNLLSTSFLTETVHLVSILRKLRILGKVLQKHPMLFHPDSTVFILGMDKNMFPSDTIARKQNLLLSKIKTTTIFR